MKPEELKEKYYKGECTKEEAALFLQWYTSQKGEEDIAAEVDKNWRSDIRTDWDNKELLASILANKPNDLYISHSAEVSSLSDSNDNPADARKSGWKIVAVAASISLILSFVYLLFTEFGKEPLHANVQMIEKTNPSGQKSTIHLKDGSRITLNSSSTVRYPVDFATDERIIELEGEAFFEVAKDESRPFRVKTAHTITTALGTSFNINAYADQDEVEIGLATGRIEVRSTNEITPRIMELEPGQGVVYSRERRKMTQTRVNIGQMTAWTSKELVFDNEEFDAVVKRLERWYGVEILVEGHVDGTLSASFKNQTLRAVLEGISYSFSLDYKVSDKKVILTTKL